MRKGQVAIVRVGGRWNSEDGREGIQNRTVTGVGATRREWSFSAALLLPPSQLRAITGRTLNVLGGVIFC